MQCFIKPLSVNRLHLTTDYILICLRFRLSSGTGRLFLLVLEIHQEKCHTAEIKLSSPSFCLALPNKFTFQDVLPCHIKSDGHIKLHCLCVMYLICLCVCSCVYMRACASAPPGDVLTFMSYISIRDDSRITISMCTNISISSVTSTPCPSEELTGFLRKHLHLFKHTVKVERLQHDPAY